MHRNDDADATPPVTILDYTDLYYIPPGVAKGEWGAMYYALALKGRGTPIPHTEVQPKYPNEYRKFNICVPLDSPLSGKPDHIPGGFSPLFPPLDPANVHDPGTTFDAVAKETAHITIPEGVISQDVIDISCFRKYVSANAISWYKFVNEVRSCDATNGDLRIVVGWDHGKGYSRTVYSGVDIDIPEELKEVTESSTRFGPFGFGVGTFGAGKPYHSLVGKEPLARGICDDVWHNLADDYRPYIDLDDHPLPHGTHFKWRSEMIDVHPANEINALLLKRFAITQDSDWISVLKPDDASLPDPNEIFSRILEIDNICEEDDIVFLEYRPEALYLSFLTHDRDISRELLIPILVSPLNQGEVRLPLWHPIVVAVGAVGYLSREDGRFITILNACAPGDSTSPGICSLSPAQPRITETIHNEQRAKSAECDLVSGLLNLEFIPSVSFPLKGGEEAAHMYTGSTRHRCFQADDSLMEWFESSIEKIVEIYGADHDVTREDLVLMIGTLDAQDYALFVSACHREGTVTFEVNVEPQVGQPWGEFLPGTTGQFTSKVSQHGDPWETILVSSLWMELT
ncbi:hypothetical protein M413DRAFT_29751 [Hebeloma cylindrosporum]|uniref:Uncharacterized protein n=1 Tax=Hebeloma cylindrosporum TaxID=76867 RepID=A0A0C2XM50_HEBCY|nr:hypothetical protein M413DRAFT_29751 [Hebeloma cylindrosporum h7]